MTLTPFARTWKARWKIKSSGPDAPNIVELILALALEELAL